MENINLLFMGSSCVAAAVVGGGLKIFGVEIPLLCSIKRQILLGLFGLGLISPVGYPEIIKFNKTFQCEKYAKLAVEQFDENLKWSCRQTGDRWHNNFAGHQGWCLTQTPASTDSEIDVRRKALDSCGKKHKA